MLDRCLAAVDFARDGLQLLLQRRNDQVLLFKLCSRQQVGLTRRGREGGVDAAALGDAALHGARALSGHNRDLVLRAEDAEGRHPPAAGRWQRNARDAFTFKETVKVTVGRVELEHKAEDGAGAHPKLLANRARLPFVGADDAVSVPDDALAVRALDDDASEHAANTVAHLVDVHFPRCGATVEDLRPRHERVRRRRLGGTRQRPAILHNDALLARVLRRREDKRRAGRGRRVREVEIAGVDEVGQADVNGAAHVFQHVHHHRRRKRAADLRHEHLRH